MLERSCLQKESNISRVRRKKAAADEPTVLIGPTTDIKKSAGAVANLVREGTPPVIKAISAANVNQAAKTLALARNYLEEEGIDVYAAVDFPEYDESSGTANVNLHINQSMSVAAPSPCAVVCRRTHPF